MYKKEKIYIYGIGDYAHRLSQWMKKNVCEVNGFVVSQNFDEDRRCEGKPVYSIRKILGNRSDQEVCILIAISDSATVRDIITYLRANKINRYIDCSGFIKSNIPHGNKQYFCLICGEEIN